MTARFFCAMHLTDARLCSFLLAKQRPKRILIQPDVQSYPVTFYAALTMCQHTLVEEEKTRKKLKSCGEAPMHGALLKIQRFKYISIYILENSSEFGRFQFGSKKRNLKPLH